jgi:superfamily II DNA or RNA helicase
MERSKAIQLLRTELDSHNLTDWKIRLNQNPTAPFLGLCMHADKTIVLNAHHVDQHPEVELINTIKHEVAHALTPGHKHDEMWAAKAREIGCDNVSPCASFSLSPAVIDAIRSGSDVEVVTHEETVRTYEFRITQLKEKCETCGKVAVFDREMTVPSGNEFVPDKKITFYKCGHFKIVELPKATPFHLLTSGGRRDCIHTWKKNTCIDCGASRPFPFQVEGMKFAEIALTTGKGCGIFDDMGLGKTIQALGLLKYHPEWAPICFGVKSAIKFQWFKAILNWMGDEFLPQIIQSSNDIVIPGLKCYIISYDLLVFKTKKMKSGKTVNQGFNVQKLIDAGIKTLVLDECQQLKNPDSSRTQEIRKLAKHTKVIALSGTPWKNNGAEFFSVLNMIDPIRFNSYTGFTERWVASYWDGNKFKLGGIRKPDEFRDYTKDFLIRRERTTVLPELPIINRQKLYVELENIEAKTYNDETSSFVKWWNEKVISGEEHSKDTGLQLLAKLSRLRHITGLAKIPATLEFVEQFVEQADNKKLLIGVHHIDVGNILYDELKAKYPDFIVLKITGSMNSLEKFEAQEKFNNNEKVLCVASTLAAGEGMNLQTANNVVLHERQWNPANEQQFEDRIIRIGQNAQSVTGTYVLGADTVDDLFDGIVDMKRNSFHKSMNTNELSNPNWVESDLMRDLANMIVTKYNKEKKAA